MEGAVKWFFSDNSAEAKLIRTIIQGIIGVAGSAIAWWGAFAPEWVSIIICPTLMAIQAPLYAYFGAKVKGDELCE